MDGPRAHSLEEAETEFTPRSKHLPLWFVPPVLCYSQGPSFSSSFVISSKGSSLTYLHVTATSCFSVTAIVPFLAFATHRASWNYLLPTCPSAGKMMEAQEGCCLEGREVPGMTSDTWQQCPLKKHSEMHRKSIFQMTNLQGNWSLVYL